MKNAIKTCAMKALAAIALAFAALTAQAAYKQEYERSFENIAGNWVMLVLFILLFAGLATIVLEMIDKDKR